MTRREFIEEVNTFSELIEFCYDESLDICEDVFSEDRLNDNIMEEVGNYDDWNDLYEFLDNIPTGYNWYRWVNGELEGCDDRFEDYKREVLEYMDEEDWWEEDTHDDEDEEVEDEAILETPESEGSQTEISLDEFMEIVGRAS